MAKACPIDNLKTILLGTDGSEFSRSATEAAISLAARCSSRLLAVNVLEVSGIFVVEAAGLVKKEEARVKENVLAPVQKMASRAGVGFEAIVKIGEEAWRPIASEARKQGAELIVLGRRGRTDLARLTMGSVTARVIGNAPCDVLVVPENVAFDCQVVAVATDGSRYSESAIREALKIADACGSRLVIISVAESPAGKDIRASEENVANAKRQAATHGIDAETITACGKAYSQIIAAAETKRAGLIVMGCRGHTGLARLLVGSVTERVIGHASAAVLVACAP